MSSMAKYLQYFKYLIWRQEKKLKNSYIGAQKINAVKVADQPSSSRLTWKNIASLIVDRIQMFFCNICRLSKLAIAILCIIFVVSIVIIGYFSKKFMDAEKPQTPQYMALIASSNQSKESVDLGLIEKVTKVTTMEVVSDMTTTALGVIIGLFCFLVVMLVLLFQLLASSLFDQNKERFEQAERENERRHQSTGAMIDLHFKLIEQRLFPDQPTHHHAPNIIQAIPPPIIFPPHNPLISTTTTTSRPPPVVPTCVHGTPISSHFTSKWCACCRRQSRESVQQQQAELSAPVPVPSAALSVHSHFPLTTNQPISSPHEQPTSTNLPPAPTSSQCLINTKSEQAVYNPSAVTKPIDGDKTTQ
uniref:Uncharacterized protein n=1 Tax=Meloidogyne enterolobii TaxID=390850 RepID=A0A6V7UZS5_MELEN|nr:unnamed protein product [Meloidogyne enterolobii]